MADDFFSQYIDEDNNKDLDKNTDTDAFIASINQDEDDSSGWMEEESSEWSEQELEEVSKENVVNQKNEEEFQEVMNNASRSLDNYWDRDNPVIKIVMICLFGFAGIGVVYYLFLWFFTR